MQPAHAAEAAPIPASAVACWAILILLVLARLAASFATPMTWWSLNLHRFLSPQAAWIPWAIAAAALVPVLSRRLTSPLGALGDLLARGGFTGNAIAALLPLVTVALLPDRVWFLGDFQLRQFTLGSPNQAVAFWYPYCLPLDLFLHDTFSRFLIHRFDLVENDAGRLLGAVEAGLLGMFAARFARALGARGAFALLAWSAVVFSGVITLFTGYNKAFTEMVVLAVAAGTFALEISSGRTSLWPLSLTVTIALFVHRSAIGLLPGYAVAVWLATLNLETRPERRRALLPALVPLAALALIGPRIFHIISATDAMHFAPEEVKKLGLLAATFAPARLVDLLNDVIVLAPLALVAPAMAIVQRGIRAPAREVVALSAIAAPMLVAALFMHPSQGLARDWDTLATPGVLASMLAVWVICRHLGGSSGLAWLAVAALVGSAAPAFQWLMHDADRDRGLARVEALISGPPVRSRHERASAWEFLGLRRMDLGDPANAADAFSHEAELEPSPQVLRHWAVVEAGRGDLGHAIEIYRGLLDRYPREASAWFEMAVLLARSGDTGAAREAANHAVQLDPSRSDWRSFLESLPGPPAPH